MHTGLREVRWSNYLPFTGLSGKKIVRDQCGDSTVMVAGIRINGGGWRINERL